jgi:hypothetical protein
MGNCTPGTACNARDLPQNPSSGPPQHPPGAEHASARLPLQPQPTPGTTYSTSFSSASALPLTRQHQQQQQARPSAAGAGSTEPSCSTSVEGEGEGGSQPPPQQQQQHQPWPHNSGLSTEEQQGPSQRQASKVNPETDTRKKQLGRAAQARYYARKVSGPWLAWWERQGMAARERCCMARSSSCTTALVHFCRIMAVRAAIEQGTQLGLLFTKKKGNARPSG